MFCEFVVGGVVFWVVGVGGVNGGLGIWVGLNYLKEEIFILDIFFFVVMIIE